MRRSSILWIAAVVLTLATAIFQRITGPSYPIRDHTAIGGKDIAYTLERSHPGEGDAPVRVVVPDRSVEGLLYWKRHKTDDAWKLVVMHRRGDTLVAALPHQPPAGKLEYRVNLSDTGAAVLLPEKSPAVLRFRGDVPTPVLILHIAVIFAAMLLSTRTGLEVLAAAPRYAILTQWTVWMLFAGGLVLGPIVQKYAFDAFWTGWPFGTDLTDNKTAIAFAGWMAAAFALQRSKHPGRWVAGAAILLIVVFLIPHSLLGSEIDYEAAERTRTGQTFPPRP